MGIKHLHQFLRKTCPHVYVEVPLCKYAFRKIALDVSIYMCKFKTTYGSNFMDAFLHMISILRYNDVHFVCVYDTKAPPEKDRERKQRIESRERTRDRVEKIRQSWDSICETPSEAVHKLHQWVNQDPEIVQQWTEEHSAFSSFLEKLQEQQQETAVDTTTTDPVQQPPLDFAMVEREVLRLENTLLSIRSEDFLLTKELFQACGIPILDAEGEAEATCAYLAKQGLVCGVLTEDTDVLAYGCPFMLHRIDYQKHTCIEIDLQEVLESLHFTYEQWLDFCILCGTDYNSNLPKMGVERSYKLILQYGSIDTMESRFDLSPLNYVRVRELFRKCHLVPETQTISYCGFPDATRLDPFVFVNNCKYDMTTFYMNLSKSRFHQFGNEEDKQEDGTSSFQTIFRQEKDSKPSPLLSKGRRIT